MRFQLIKIIQNCVDGRNLSGTMKVRAELILNEKKNSFGKSFYCNQKFIYC